IKKYVEKNDVLAEIESNSSPSADANEYVYYLPSQCRPNVELILNTLKSSGIIEQKSRITRHTTSTFTLRILDRFQNQELFDSLFSRVDCMLQTGYIHCECNDKSGSVIVKFNDLTVRNLDCTSAKQGVSGMLDYLAQERYIIALDKTDLRHVSFCFTTPQIKDLLSLEGRMLEVYTYHKARECGEFNDIRSSLEIDWDCIDVQNEFDCILTKGFNALFVECKATVQIKADYYNKLHTLTQKFGINAKAVLVADTQNTNTANSNQKQRGNALHIITITDPDEIANIGETLLHLLD
ncbi:MAG: DUF1887 family protein, partial [Oscillospiraceae bacterium]|nr:DUF1887 family protein [Oscillospiraceae bacterium]